MTRISYQEFQQKLLNIDIPDAEIAEYVQYDQEASGPFNPVFKPDRARVSMTEEEIEAENAMAIGNGLARFRRQLRFKRQVKQSNLPVLVAEGDSWFQFPILIDDVVDCLADDFLIWCTSAAGDTAQNMVFGEEGRGKREYLRALRERKNDNVRAFLFSAAGNDIIGQDASGNPVLFGIVKDYVHGGSAADHINMAVFGEKLAFLKNAYIRVVNEVHNEPGFANLPIIIHGYDYAIPGSEADPRRPSYAKRDQWLGAPLMERKIKDPQLQRDIIRILIDGLYDMLKQVTNAYEHVHLVDVRGTLSNVSDWNDEIHGTSAGFKRVAAKFKNVLGPVI